MFWVQGQGVSASARSLRKLEVGRVSLPQSAWKWAYWGSISDMRG